MAKYKYVKRKHHVLSPPSGVLPEHRVILFEKIGLGPHRCHWCRTGINWNADVQCGDGDLVADHVDGDTRNNDPANLVESCHACNVIRARDHRFEGVPFIVNAQGRREAATEKVCGTCGATFLIATKHLKRPEKGRFCSRRCMYDRPR